MASHARLRVRGGFAGCAQPPEPTLLSDIAVLAPSMRCRGSAWPRLCRRYHKLSEKTRCISMHRWAPRSVRAKGTADRPWRALLSTSIAAPAIRAVRRQTTKSQRGRGPRRKTARSSARSRGRKPPVRNFQAPLRRHRALRLPCRGVLPADPLSPCVPGHAFRSKSRLRGRSRETREIGRQ